MKNGFYTALGTPTDENGNFLPKSFAKQVDDQIEAGASGLLVMGSMGIGPCIRRTDFAAVSKAATDAAHGRCPVLTGVMDNSIATVCERIDALKGQKIDGVVATTPFYFFASQPELKRFFGGISQHSPFPLYLYDLPVVTKVKITLDTLDTLMEDKNIRGIKTGDLFTARALLRKQDQRPDFDIIYSGLDAFDTAYAYGIQKNLDGMFSCTPTLAQKMYTALKNGDVAAASAQLDGILALRNVFIEVGVTTGFTVAMNLLGYEGIYAQDYAYNDDKGNFEKVRFCMQNLKLI